MVLFSKVSTYQLNENAIDSVLSHPAKVAHYLVIMRAENSGHGSIQCETGLEFFAIVQLLVSGHKSMQQLPGSNFPGDQCTSRAEHRQRRVNL